MKKPLIKKGIFTLAACSIALLATAACNGETENPSSVASANSGSSSSEASSKTSTPPAKVDVTNATEALGVLKTGNEQFLQGSVNPNVTEATRKDLAENGQKPHTVVITCSDSRVPPELIFNSGLGEVFVIRTAGNVVGDYEIGSVEYAVDHLGSPLVLVMGHTHCGAVGAAVEGGHAPGHVADIVEEITPSVTKAKQQETDSAKIADVAENLNVENSVNNLMESDIISKLVKDGKVEVKGCKYDINTGKIQYFEDNTQTQTSQGESSAASSKAQ